jgi:glucose-1-phosphate thymidylyltransferase
MCPTSRAAAGGRIRSSTFSTPDEEEDLLVSEVVAVILARGLGSRMRDRRGEIGGLTEEQDAAASAGLKALVPLSSGDDPPRPFLDYALNALGDAGFRNVGIVVAPDHRAMADAYSGDRTPTRLTLEFIVQAEPLGTADAVRAARTFVGARPFVVLNADNLYPTDVLSTLRRLNGPGLPGFYRDELVRSSGIPPERVASYALLRVGGDGVLHDLIEKPGIERIADAGPRAFISMNCWRFDERIFEACRDVPRSSRGEFELPEAVRLAVIRGVMFQVFPARGPVLDLSGRDDIRNVETRLAGLDVRL